MRALLVVRNLAAAEPIGLMQMAALLKSAGHAVRLVGARHTRLDRAVADLRPDLVGFSACTGEHRYMLRLNRWLRGASPHRFISMFGGPHATFFPEMIDEPGVDAVCRGEGEGAIMDVAEAIDAGRPIDPIDNLWVKSTDGSVRRNPLRPLVADLDALPFADREVRYAELPNARDYPVKSFLASRGCPYRCTYCFNAGYGDLYGPAHHRPRTRSVANLVEEIEQVRATARLEFVQFRESIFPWQDDWLAEFADVYRRRVGLPFYCHVRPELVTPQRAGLLRRAGCVSVNMGIECGDEDYRREVLGRSMTNDQIVQACRTLKSNNIRILADNMVGLPGAGLAVDLKTLQLNRRCDVDYPLAMIFQPYPGTQLGRRAADEGWFDGDLDAIQQNYYLRSPLKFEPAEKRRIENLQKFFAVLVEAPWLEPLVWRLLDRQPNMVFLSIFRAWYMWCYTRRIVPHRPAAGERRELLNTLFGRFAPEVHREVELASQTG